MNNEALIRAWQKWTEPMLPEAHKGTVPLDSLYYQAFKAGWEAAVDAQVTAMSYEIESLEQKLREERNKK